MLDFIGFVLYSINRTVKTRLNLSKGLIYIYLANSQIVFVQGGNYHDNKRIFRENDQGRGALQEAGSLQNARGGLCIARETGLTDDFETLLLL